MTRTAIYCSVPQNECVISWAARAPAADRGDNIARGVEESDADDGVAAEAEVDLFSSAARASSLEVTRESPKSVSRTWPSASIIMFSGFRSLRTATVM